MKRLLSWLLALVMIISCLPMSAIPAFAEETPETGVGDIQNPDFETPIDKLDPVVIEEFAWTYTPAVQIAGDAEGNFYIYTAPADGTVTLYFTEVPEGTVQEPEINEDGEEVTPAVTAKYEGDIIVTINDKDEYSLLKDGVDNYGRELQIPVKKDDVLEINTKLTADHQGNEYPAGEYTWCGNFAYPIGSEQNPINIEWEWDKNYVNATATVIVPEGGAYYTGKAGMILTVGETVTAMDETGKFNIAAAGTYELKLATPVGAQANPEVIENINGFSDTVSLKADGAYNYIWTATEDGTVTLDVTDGANITVDKLTYVEDSEWPTSEQFALAEPTVDENWNYTGWTVAENLAIEVVAGQQLKIQVNGLTDWATWSVPAIEYTLTGSFEAAVKCDHENLSANTVCPECGMYKLMGATINLGNSLQFAFFAKKVSIDSNGYAVVTHTMEDGTVNTFTYRKGDPEWVDGTNVRINYNGLAAKHMADQLTCTFYNASGEPISLTWVDSMRDYAMRQVKNESNHITLRIAVVDMLIYGAASQVALGYNTGDMADRYLGDYRELATKSVVATNSIVKDEAYYGSVISVDNEIQFSIYLKNKVLTNIDSLTARITYKNHNGAQKKTELKKGDASWVHVGSSYTRFYITGLTVADWAQDITLEMVDANGTTVYSTNVDSMESYIARQIEKDGENAPAVFQAIAKFGTSAYNYFHRNDK